MPGSGADSEFRLGRGEEPPDRTASRVWFIVLAATAIAAIVTTSQILERFINRVWRPDFAEWTWISDAVFTVALLVMTTLWGRLRLARTAVADLERERVAIQAELMVAANVQRALLPSLPPRTRDMAWHAAMEPAGQVGGDYYDFFSLGVDQMCVVLADVSGKGVPAAVFVSNTRAVLRAVAREHSTPRDLLRVVSETLRQDGRGTVYVTCFVAVVDVAQHRFVYANAGHPPGLIRTRGRGIHALDVGGPPLGLLPDARYEEACVALEPGDLVVVVSDGITDAIDATGKRIPQALGAALATLTDPTPKGACAELLRRARGAPGPPDSTGWDDDRTVVAFDYSPVSRDS